MGCCCYATTNCVDGKLHAQASSFDDVVTLVAIESCDCSWPLNLLLRHPDSQRRRPRPFRRHRH